MSKWGSGHPKALEKRERTANTKNAAQQAKQKAKEDAFWHDDDKVKETKENRAAEKENKRQNEIDRKAELKKLADEEMAGLKSKAEARYDKSGKSGKNSGGGGGKKLTKAQIAQRKALDELNRLETQKQADLNKPNAFKMLDEDEPLPENVNRAENDFEVITDIDGAISALSGSSSKPVDRHPEKRQKSAYKEFEEARYAELKAENPSLKMSQLRQMLRKEWKKSPLNPMNAAQ